MKSRGVYHCQQYSQRSLSLTESLRKALAADPAGTKPLIEQTVYDELCATCTDECLNNNRSQRPSGMEQAANFA